MEGDKRGGSVAESERGQSVLYVCVMLEHTETILTTYPRGRPGL